MGLNQPTNEDLGKDNKHSTCYFSLSFPFPLHLRPYAASSEHFHLVHFTPTFSLSSSSSS